MLKRSLIKKMIITTSVLFTMLLMCLIPKKEKVNMTQKLEYVNSKSIMSTIYLLDKNNYLGKTEIVINSNDVMKKAKYLIETLIDGKNDAKIPSGFNSVIPSDTKILSIEYDENIMKINFSKELLDTKKENETKIIEAIIYTLTSIDNVDKVIIYVDGNILTKLPKSGINLPSTLDRNYGINKKYDITTYKDLTNVTLYYLSKHNDNYYYVPVTKYLNTTDSKIDVIIEELSKGIYEDDNLISFLNSDIRLIKNDLEDNKMSLVFNEFIFNDVDTFNISNEVITSISLSVADTYSVDEVIFKYDDKEIYKSVIKILE